MCCLRIQIGTVLPPSRWPRGSRQLTTCPSQDACVYVCVCGCVCVRESGSPWPFKVRPRVGPSLPRQLGAARIPFGGPPDHGQEVHQAADVHQSIGQTATKPEVPVDLPFGPLVRTTPCAKRVHGKPP